MLKLTAQDQQAGDFVQTGSTPWRLTVIDSNVCSNVQNANGSPFTCTVSHAVRPRRGAWLRANAALRLPAAWEAHARAQRAHTPRR